MFEGTSIQTTSTIRLARKPGSPTITDNIRVFESAQEVAYRPAINDVEDVEERILALRTDPLQGCTCCSDVWSRIACS